jgi:hypothetical protein
VSGARATPVRAGRFVCLGHGSLDLARISGTLHSSASGTFPTYPRQAKAQPIQALAELIWNALDADATAVNIDFEHDAIGGMSKIVVTDNGHGIPRAEAPQLFKNLGGSWAAMSKRITVSQGMRGWYAVLIDDVSPIRSGIGSY